MRGTGTDSLQSWRVAFACFFVYMMQYGVNRLSGVLFIASMRRYGVGREAASFPYTFNNVVTSVAGPIVGCLGQKCGARSVAVFGSMLSAVGVGLCYFAEDVAIVTLLFGILYGFGMACCICLLPVMINEHFNEKRATASGISLSGVCVGSFIIPPVTQVLIDNYGLSETFLILSGLLLSCLPASLLLRSRPKTSVIGYDEGEKLIADKPQIYSAVCKDTCKILSENDVKHISGKANGIGFDSSENNLKDLRNFKESLLNNQGYVYQERKVYILNNKDTYVNELPDKVIEGNCSPTCNYQCCCSTSKTEARNNNSTSKIQTLRNHKKEQNALLSDNRLDFRRVKDCTSENYNGDLQDSADEKTCLIVSDITRTTPKITDKKSHSQHLRILLDPIFIMIVTTVSSYSFMMVCLMTIIVDFSIDIGIDNIQQKYILMAISGGEFMGRLSLGWVTDGRYMSPTRFMAFSFMTQGLAALGIGLSTGFPMLMCMLALHGFLHSGVPIVFCLIVADYIEEDKQNFPISSSGFLAGPLILCVSPLIGYFRKELGSYTYLFFGMSIISVICGFLWIAIPFFISQRYSNTGRK